MLKRAVPLVLVAVASAHAAPLFVAHQGRLLDGDDKPVTAQLQLKFEVYDVENDPTGESIAPRWQATYPVKVTTGLYSVLLGDTTGSRPALTPEVFDGTGRLWLGVTIEGGSELKPRLAISAAPLALRAGRATFADDSSAVGGESPAQLHDAAKLTGVVPAAALGVGSTGLTTVGPVVTGTWRATPIEDAYVAGAAGWNAKLDKVVHDGSLLGDGRGTPLTVAFGTSAGTVAAGDDPRFSQLGDALTTTTTAIGTAKNDAIAAANAATDTKLAGFVTKTAADAAYVTKTAADATYVAKTGGGLRTATASEKVGMLQGESITVTHPADPDRLVSVLVKGAASGSAFAVDFEDGAGKDLVSGVVPQFTGGQSSVGTTPKFGAKALYFYDFTHYASWSLPSGNLNLGSGDFTIRFWFRTNQGFLSGGFWGNVVGTAYNDSTASGGWVIGMNSLGGLRFLRNGALNTLDVTTKYAANRWYHIAVERFSGTIRGYVDGASIGSFSDTSAIGGSASTMYVGGLLDWDNEPQAWVDDVEVLKAAAYRGTNFTPPSTSDLSVGSTYSLVEDSTRYRVDYVSDTTTRVTKLTSGPENARVVVHSFK